jgi:AraC-like DNA-binding protein
MTSFRDFWKNYKEEILFALLLSAFTVLSHWLSRFIPVDLLENVLLLAIHSINTAICFFGAVLLFRHSDGLRIRKASAYALAIWGIADMFFMIQTYLLDQPVLNLGSEDLTVYMLFAGNFLGWLLLIYPTETLRPGWLTWKRALCQLLPLVVLCAVDYFVPYDLRWLISLYPVGLFIMVLTHIRAYRIWCENNYSSMEHIDVQWIVRYLIMLAVLGASYGYMMVSDNPCRAFTQNILIGFMFVYSIEQILFRRDPWDNLLGTEEVDNEQSDTTGEQSEKARKLEQWMETEKPYLDPNFKLIDLMRALPMNRTYLSEFINTTYGCTFYQFVTRYRIEEAKRIMRENSELKMADVAARSGFSSQSAFSRTFTRETGQTPREWYKNFSFA